MKLKKNAKIAGIFPMFIFAAGIITCPFGRGVCFAQDKVAAIVNNDVITQKDLNDFLNFMRVQLSAEYKGQELENKIQSMKLDLLDRLIEDKLILQEARRKKMVIDEGRVKSRIEEIKEKMGSDAEFQKSLKQQGLVQADIEAKIRDQFLMYGSIEMEIRSKIVVDPSEITDFYGRHKEEFKSRELREIESVSVEEEGVAANVFDELSGGKTVKEVSEKYKVQTNKFNIGKGEELRKEIEQAIFDLKVNEVSKPVRIENKFYIFIVNKITPSEQQTLDEAMETIQSYLFEKEMQEALAKWIDELKKNSYIKILSD